MKKKLIKPSPKKKKDLTQNQFGVILEDINGKFDLLVEGHEVLGKKIDDVRIELKEEIGELRGEFFSFKSEMTDFKKDTESNFKQVFQHLSKIEDELMSIKTEIADLKKTLTQKADIDKVILLEERIVKIDRQLAQSR